MSDSLRDAQRRYYESFPEPLRSLMLAELDYDPAKDPLRKDVVRVPLAPR